MHHLHLCTRGHLIEHWGQYTNDVAHLRCTEQIVRETGTNALGQAYTKRKGNCGCSFRPVRNKALKAAYLVGGFPAAQELAATMRPGLIK